ncbi:hypothetical protein JYU34_002986 [Plutella xylostella]|uniref:Uncharacterized protein n=1 Tax=Plutella xylostella TaxID=51655 RepID=A0ABQ7R3L8_PLUXY|nr:hypothetical protein JYU34_002986 [Plutella xylostella]
MDGFMKTIKAVHIEAKEVTPPTNKTSEGPRKTTQDTTMATTANEHLHPDLRPALEEIKLKLGDLANEIHYMKMEARLHLQGTHLQNPHPQRPPVPELLRISN